MPDGLHLKKITYQLSLTNWFYHILRRNCLLHDAVEGQMTEVKRVGKEKKKNTAP